MRIKNYRELQQLAESDPHSNDLYQANLIDNFYPNRPTSLAHVCLFDFVKWYRRGDNDAEGRRQYVRLGKPKIPNHRIYDPNKPDEREAYFYSLLLLFVPFTDMSHNWSVKVKQQKKPLMNILRIIAPWKSIMRVYKECFKHNLK